ncbi:MAG: MATE family efflux transporter [Deltaproteobacteria bacterium]|nr:MATE family efflux transporter [Deltaproteobacteria bacterium]
MPSTPPTAEPSTDSKDGSAPPPLLALPPGRAVWLVAGPMIALGLLRTSYFLTDSWFVGRLGDGALEAIGGAAFAWWMIHICCDLAGTGAHALVARYEGAQQRERIAGTLVQGLWVSAAVTALLMALIPGRGLYFDLLGYGPATEAYALGSEYVRVCLLGCGTLAVYAVVTAAFRALGQTRTALALTAVTLVVNLGLDPALIWGWGPFPELGIGGAAWATSIANSIGAVVGLVILRRRGIHLVLVQPERAVTALITRIGTPITIAGLGFSAVYVLLGRIISDFGSFHMAALGIGHRLESLAYMITVGFSVGAATMVGQHLGAGSPERAAESVRAALRICTAFMLPCTALLMAGAPWFFDAFTDDPAIIESGTVYLRWQAVVFVAMGIEVVYEGGFSGAGDTVPPLIISGSLTAARIPMAWVFGYTVGLGIVGVWIAIAVSTGLKAIVSWWWWRRGNWKTALTTE